MARIRYLKPDFFKDEDVGELSFQARLLYAGLWTQADKEGRLEDRPKRLKVEIMPYDDVDIEKILKDLSISKKNSHRPFIQRYEVDGEKYIQILKWHNHQKPHHTEQASKIPPAPPLLNIKIKGMEKQLKASTELSNGVNTVKTPLRKCELQKVYLFWYYFISKVKKPFKLTLEKHNLILKRFRDGYDLKQLEQAVDNFVADPWEGRKNRLNLIYCIGKQRGKPDNLEKWLNIEQKKDPLQEKGKEARDKVKKWKQEQNK